MNRAPLCLLALLALSACTEFNPRGFDVDYPANRPATMDALAQRVAGQSFDSPPALLALIPVAPARGVTVFSLPEGRRLWQSSTPLDVRPTFVDNVLVGHSARQVLGWDARTGTQRWQVPDSGYTLVGAGGDARTVALALGPGGLNRRRGTLLAVDAQTGATRFSREIDQPLGHPTLADNLLFVPWSSQYLSVFDLGRNEEVGRLRSPEDIYAHAWREGSGVYFGARTLYRLGAGSSGGQRDPAQSFRLEREDLPGNPTLTLDGYDSSMAGTNARERVALSWRFDPAQPGVHFTDNALYVVFHRVVFCTDAATGAVRWAWTAPGDLAGLRPVRGGLVAVDDHGTAFFLEAAAGNARWHHDLGMRPAQAILQVPLEFSPPAVEPEAPQSAAATLLVAAGGTDNRMLPARLFATHALGTMAGPEATRALLELASQRDFPPTLVAAAGEALGRRTEGLEPLLQALGQHYHFVRGTQAPPVGAIARALGAARERRAVPLLVAHLNDPGTPATELPDLVSALRTIGDAAAVPALLDFLRLYHADDGAVPGVDGSDAVNDRSLPDQDAINTAAGLCAQTIVTLGSATDRRWLAAILTDANTLGPVRAQLTAAVGAASAPAPGSGAPTPGPGEPVETPTVVVDPSIPPARLTTDAITGAFAPVRDAMLACLNGLTSRPAQIRLTFFYDTNGHISNLVVTPPTLGQCISPTALTVSLPRSGVGRDIGIYYLLGGPQ